MALSDVNVYVSSSLEVLMTEFPYRIHDRRYHT